MAYVQANILWLPCTSIHTPREKMIERAILYQDTLEELYIKEPSETYRLCCLSHGTTGTNILLLLRTIPQGMS
jgi:hypothetical protein